MASLVTLIIMIFFRACLSHILNPGIIKDYFNIKSINRITILSCFKPGEAQTFLEEMKMENFIFSFNYESLDDSRRLGAVLDLSCSDRENVISWISKNRKFNIGKYWLIFNDKPFNNALELLKNSYILPDSSVVIVQGRRYFSIYKIKADGEFKIEITVEEDVKNDEFFKKGKDRSDFENSTLQSASVIMHPELYKGFDDMDNPEIDTWPKMHYPLAANLAQQLNFKFNLTILDDYGWLKNESFSGLMGLLQRNEIDFAATGFFIREDRMTAVDFTSDTYSLKSMIIFKQPALSTVSNIFLLPFSKLVWLSLGVLSLLVVLILLFEVFILKKFHSKSFKSSVTILDVVTLVLGFVCQQGTDLNPISLSSRIIIVIFSLSALFFYTSYSAKILALLQSTSPVLKNLTDLTESRLTVKIQDLEYNRIFMRGSVDPNVKELYDKKIKPFGMKAYCSPREGVRLLRTGEVAFQVEVNLGYKIISETFGESEKCGLGEIQLLFIPSLSLPVTKKSGYRDIFTRKFIWQRENGILDRIAKIWIPRRPQCEGKGKDFLRVGIVDFLPAILSLVYGSSISMGILILEILYFYRSKYISCLHQKEKWVPLSRRLETEFKF